MSRTRPKVTHSSRNKEVSKLTKIMTSFTQAALGFAKSAAGAGTLPDPLFSVEGGELLKQRKRLAQALKQGMLERKDKELEIAIFAALVWYNRLEQKRQRDILEEWG